VNRKLIELRKSSMGVGMQDRSPLEVLTNWVVCDFDDMVRINASLCLSLWRSLSFLHLKESSGVLVCRHSWKFMIGMQHFFWGWMASAPQQYDQQLAVKLSDLEQRVNTRPSAIEQLQPGSVLQSDESDDFLKRSQELIEQQSEQFNPVTTQVSESVQHNAGNVLTLKK
jgi:hypothetical protein